MPRSSAPTTILLLAALCGWAPAQASVAAEDSAWQRLAREDLTFIHETIARDHPGPLDTENPGFARWHAEGYAHTLSRLREVRGFGGWQHLLRLYVEGFADEHLALEFHVEPRAASWAGITLAWNGEAFEVRDTASDIQLAPKAKLESCEGMSSEELWQRQVAPFYARADRPALRFRHAHRLLLSNGNPLVPRLQRCLFSNEGKTTEIELAWRQNALATLPTGPMLDQSRPARLAAFGERAAWLSLPTFGPRGAAADVMASALANLAALEGVEALVVDLRGNGGGSSHWTEVFLSSLYGDAFREYTQQRFVQAQGPMALEYRVSAGNLAHFESLLPLVVQQAGEGSDAHLHFSGVIDGLRRGLTDGTAFYRTEAPSPRLLEGQPAEPRYRGRVLLLTDHTCASACLSFVERLLDMPGVVQIGQPTSADTTYMEVRSVALPSQLGYLNFATKVYRGRSRAGDGDFHPQHAFVGDLSDDVAVQAWVTALLAELRKAEPRHWQ